MTWASSIIAFVFLLLWQTPNVKCTDDLTTDSESDLYMPIKPIEDFELEKNISAKCKKLGICDHVHLYPETIINDVIRNLTEIIHAKIFYSEECPLFVDKEKYKHIQTLCEYESQCFTPKAVKSHTGTWYLVLNTKESPLQVFTGRVYKPNRRYKILMPNKFNITCQQVYFERPMIVLNSEMNAVVLKHLPVPCCCKCYSVSTGNTHRTEE